MAAGSGSFNARAYLCPQLNHSASHYIVAGVVRATKQSARAAIARKFRIFKILLHPTPALWRSIASEFRSFVRVFNNWPFVFLATLAPHECTRFLRSLLRIFSCRIFFRLRAHDPLLSLPFLRVTSVRFSFARVSET